MGVIGPWERCVRLPRGGGVPLFSGAVAKTAVLQNTKKNKKKKAVHHTKRCWRVPVNITKWEDWQTAWWSGKYHVRVPATSTGFNGNATENSLSVVAAAQAENPGDATAGNPNAARFQQHLATVHNVTRFWISWRQRLRSVAATADQLWVSCRPAKAAAVAATQILALPEVAAAAQEPIVEVAPTPAAKV